MNRILRHIKEGIIGVIRHFALSLSSISSVTVTLLIMAVFLLLSSNLTEITKQMETTVQIHVQIEPEVTEQADIDAIGTQISNLPNVESITYSSKEAELEAFIALNDADDAEQLFGSFRGETNPMLDAYLVTTVSGDTMKEVSTQIENLEGVRKSTYGGEATSQFVTGLEQIRNVGFFIVAALGVVAVFLISNTIRVSIHSRQKEIGIMRNVGATNWYIRWPFVIEGLIIGMMGSIIPICVTIFGYQYLVSSTGGFLYSRMLTLSPADPLVFQISGLLLLIGMVVGGLGSLLSVGKFLRWTR